MAAERRRDSADAGWLERCLACAVLFLSTGALVPLLRLHNAYFAAADVAEGDPVIQRVWLTVYAVVAVLLFGQRRRLGAILIQNWALWALVALSLLSVVWSEAPGLTFRRSVSLIGTTGFGVYLAVRYSPRRIFSMLLVVFGVAAPLSLMFALLLPSYGLLDGWRGVFLHKNSLGGAMALATPMWALQALRKRRRLPLTLLLLGLSSVLLVLSNSKSSWVVCAVLLGCLPLVATLRRPGAAPALLMLFGVVVPVMGAWLLANPGPALTALGRDATLTGRTNLWPLVWRQILQRPWLGYGYSAFWRGLEGPSGEIAKTVGEIFATAHQGVLNLWLDLGLAGVLLFGWTFLLNLRRSYATLGRQAGIDGAFPFIFMIFIVVSNLTESNILAQNSLTWVLYVTISIQLATEAERYAQSGEPATQHMRVKETGRGVEMNVRNSMHGEL